MAATIDYFFTSISPFTYFGHAAVRAVADRHGATLVARPFNLATVWEVSGGLPPGKRTEMRQRSRWVELQRIAEFRGLPVTPKPRYWPTDPTLADHTIIALAEAGEDPLDYIGRLLAAQWAESRNIADPETLGELLEGAGFDAAKILSAATDEKIAAIRARNSEDAIAADAIGAPAYVLNGEAFWGQDRIEYLDRALATGRGPFKPL